MTYFFFNRCCNLLFPSIFHHSEDSFSLNSTTLSHFPISFSLSLTQSYLPSFPGWYSSSHYKRTAPITGSSSAFPTLCDWDSRVESDLNSLDLNADSRLLELTSQIVSYSCIAVFTFLVFLTPFFNLFDFAIGFTYVSIKTASIPPRVQIHQEFLYPYGAT